MMEGSGSSETSVHLYTTRRHIPEDSDLHIHRQDNLINKYYVIAFVLLHLTKHSFPSTCLLAFYTRVHNAVVNCGYTAGGYIRGN
jgi:hypothetical protein